jgi:hypothetical protein
MEYELAFAIDNFSLHPGAKSEMLGRIADAFRDLDIQIGSPAIDVRIVQRGDLAVATNVPPKVRPSQRNEIR